MVQFGAGTGSDYGTGVLDTKAVLTTGDIISLALLDDFQDAIVAIETLLGAAPEGFQASVQARLAAGNFPTLLIDASDAKIIVKDTDGVWGTAIPSIEFQDSNATIGGSIALDTGQDFVITNANNSGNLELRTLNGEVQIIDSDAKLVIQDTDGAWGTAIPSIELRDSAGTAGGSVGITSDGHFIIQSSVEDGEIILSPGAFTGQVNITHANPILQLTDTDAATDTLSKGRVNFGRTASPDLGHIGFFSTITDTIEFTNNISSGDIEFNTSSGDFVFVTLPSSDPVKAGALWNNSGVVNVSAG